MVWQRKTRFDVPDGQRQRGEEVEIGAIDRLAAWRRGRIDPLAEHGVQLDPVLADRPPGQLRKLVVPQDQVDAVGILALEGADQVDELVERSPPSSG